MAKSMDLDHVLQPDGTYKWEEVELDFTAWTAKSVEECPAPTQK